MTSWFISQIHESEVQLLMTNQYPIAAKKKEMLAKGKTQEEADEWETLASEIMQVIASKQLVPTMRTQCMRTAFQIPFDATVRISLDTNLCMISERGYNLQDMKVWHRDKESVLKNNEITRFPHAVLEIKLEMKGGNMTPPKWVTDLQNSGMLYEVCCCCCCCSACSPVRQCHKYSKFVHGCAVLLTEDVQYVPYWVDDVSLRDSIIESEGFRLLPDSLAGTGPGANQVYDHLLPFGTTTDDRSATALGRTNADKNAAQGLVGERAPLLTENDVGVDFYDEGYEDEEYGEGDGHCGWPFPFCSGANDNAYEFLTPTSVQKIEPKVFFANERTFLHWLHHGVILSTIASGILAFVDETGASWGEVYAMAMLVLALFYCLYALYVFLWRADRIKTRIPGRWDDSFGPLFLGSCLALVLSMNFILKLYTIAAMAKEEL
jgi:VTC domain/Domain of unknown function (DUF202)